MSKYGEVALRAIQLVRDGVKESASDAWDAAVHEFFADKDKAREKGCPKGAFLGLCEEGMVVGISPGHYTGSKKNKSYAIEAVRFLRGKPSLGLGSSLELWRVMMNGEEKQHNSQMDVVLTLWSNNMLSCS